MSDGIKRMHEDMEDWAEFCEKAQLNNTFDMYSEAARVAKNAHQLYNLSGDLLVEYINLELKQKDLIRTQAKKTEEYKEYLRLKKIFE